MKTVHLQTGTWDRLRMQGWLSLALSGWLCLLSVSVCHADSDRANVLVLHSYHKATWSDSIFDGIQSVLGGENGSSYFIEYMDTKKLDTDAYLADLYTLYQRKYRDMQFDVVIASDDNAYQFALRHHQDLLKNAPLVFCGVSKFNPDQIAGRPVTGVLETEPYDETLAIAFKLLPETKTVYILCDHTATSLLNLAQFRSIMDNDYPEVEYKILRDLTVDEMIQALQSAEADSFLFSNSWWYDKTGRAILQEEYTDILRQANRPVFGVSNWQVSRGVIGGKCISPFQQGFAAGQLAQQILNGRQPQSLAVMSDPKDTTLYIFDATLLKRYGIPLSAIPQESKILNDFRRKYEITRGVLLAIIGGFVILLGMVACLLFFMAYRQKIHKVLQEKERRYRNLVEVNCDWMWEVDCRGVFTYVSPQVQEILGYEPDDLIGKSAFDLMPPAEAERNREQFLRIVAQRDSIRHMKNINLDADGNEVMLETNGIPILDKHGNLLGYRGIDRDIAQRRRMEIKLLRQQAELESIFKASPTGIGLVCNRQLMRVNDRICEMTGYSRDELIGQSARMLYRTQADYDYVGQEKYRQVQEKGTGTVEVPWVRKDGTAIDVLLSSTPLDVSDLEKGVTFTALDISKMKAAERELRESQAQLDSIIQSAPTGIAVLIDRVIQSANQQFCDILGYSQKELVGKNIRVIYETEQEYDEAGRDIYTQIREVGIANYECRFVRKNGQFGHGLVRGMPIDPNDWSKGITFTVLDITERKLADQALIESEKRFRQVIESSPMGFNVYTLQPDGQLVLTDTNEAAQSILKRDLSEVIGKPIEEAFPELAETNRPALYKQIAQRGGTCHLNNFDYPEEQRGAGGFHDIYIFQSAPNKVAVMFLDVTEQRQVQQLLEFHQRATDHAGEGVYWITENAGFSYVNEAACRMLGYSCEELLNMTVMDIDPSVTKDNWGQLWDTTNEKGLLNLETQHRRKDGRLIPVEICSNFVEYEGQIYHCAFSRDISERKESEKMLQESEYKHRMLFESATDAIVILENGQCVECNPRTVELYRLKDASEMIGKTPIDFSPEFQEDGQRSDEKAADIIAKTLAGQTQRTAWVHCYPDGQRFYVEVSLNRLDLEGKVLIQAVVRDMTEQVRVQRSLEFTQYATDHAVEGAFWLGEDGKLVYVNEAACRMLGYTREELLEMTIPDLDPNFPREGWTDHWTRSKAPGHRRFETQHRAKDGRLIPVEVTSNFVEYEGREYHCSYSRDITERKQAEEALRESEYKHRLLYTSANDAIFIMDDTNYLECNPRAVELFGCEKAEQLLNHSPADFSPEYQEDGQRSDDKAHDLLTKAMAGELSRCSWVHRRRNGEKFYVQMSLSRLEMQGRVFVQAVVRDVTEQRIAEKAIEESENKHRLLFTSANDAIFIMDQYQFLECNPRAIELYGCRRADELLAHSPADFSPEYQEDGSRSDDKAAAYITRAMAGQPQRFSWVHTKLNGELFYAEVALNRLEWEGHSVIQAMVRDVTEQRVAEKAREKLLNELRSKNEELESIVFIASHDLRSPLVNIRGFAGELEKSLDQLQTLLDKESLSPEAMKELEYLFETDIPESLSFIISGNRKMDVLLNGLLKLSRIGAAQVTTSRLNMDKMLQGIIEGFSFIIHEGQAQISIQSSVPDCYGDNVLINQVFSNLIDNAIKYRHPNRIPQIHITAQVEENRVTYCVVDNGIGIAPEHINKVFEIFHQLSPDAETPGEGLGLTIVRRILARQDGTIWMESEVEVGTKVFVQLPLA